MRNQCADADDGVIQVLRKFVADCRADFLVSFAVKAVSGGESLDVRNSLKVPNEDMRHAGILENESQQSFFILTASKYHAFGGLIHRGILFFIVLDQ
jgi:hypothetical protein